MGRCGWRIVMSRWAPGCECRCQRSSSQLRLRSLTYANTDTDIWRGSRSCLLANAVSRVAIGSGVAGGEVVDCQISHKEERSQAK
jgi:hypothetical protein